MSMTIHFLNVGNGDCTIIELPDGNLMMVDICNGGGTNRQKTDPIHYLDRLGRHNLFQYVQTHPDMDHMDGLAALASKYNITNFWDTENNKPRPDFSSPYAKGKPQDWNAYQRLREKAVYRYRGTEALTRKDGTPLPYGLYVLHPTREAVAAAKGSGDWNNAAYVLLLQDRGFKALIAGDVDDGVWEELYWWARQNNAVLSLISDICVFKVSHHGRRSGYCGSAWLSLTNPKEIVISKGSVPGEQSAYGNYYNYLNGADHLWLTSQGDVICGYDSRSNRYWIDYQQ